MLYSEHRRNCQCVSGSEASCGVQEGSLGGDRIGAEPLIERLPRLGTLKCTVLCVHLSASCVPTVINMSCKYSDALPYCCVYC